MALAGLAGMVEVSGVVHRLQERFSPGYGYTAIIIAWLAKLNPLAIIPVSYLFAALLVGGDVIQPAGIAQMLQGVILFVVVGGEMLLQYRIRIETMSAMELGFLVTLLAAGIRSGTGILFASIGEIFAERAGVLNVGIEGMMLMGAVTAYGLAYSHRQPVAGPAGRHPGRRDHGTAASPLSPSRCAPTRW